MTIPYAGAERSEATDPMPYGWAAHGPIAQHADVLLAANNSTLQIKRALGITEAEAHKLVTLARSRRLKLPDPYKAPK